MSGILDNSATANSNADYSECGSAGGEPEREQWRSNTAFLFAAIGAAVGLGTVIRFPFLAYKYGGLAFLIPYILSGFLVGVPLLGAELMMGQRMQRGEVESLALIHPRAWGIGAVAIVGGILILLYYNIIMGWAWIYLFNSFKTPLPWATPDDALDDPLDFATAFFKKEAQGQPEGDECFILGSGNLLGCGLGTPHWPMVLALALQVCNCGANY